MSDESEEEFDIREKIHKPKAIRQVKTLEKMMHQIKGKEIERANYANAGVERQIDELHELEIM